MNRKTTADALLAAAILLCIALLLAPSFAHATGKPETPTATPAPTSSTSSATSGSQAKAAIDLSLATSATGGQGGAGGLGGAGGSGQGGSVTQGNTYVLPAPATAAPLPGGLCPKGDSETWSFGFGFLSWSRSSTRTEMECLDKVLAVLRETAPKPVPAVVNYLHELPVPAAPASAPAAAAPTPACEKAPEPVKPASKPAKVAKAAPKKSGTCG